MSNIYTMPRRRKCADIPTDDDPHKLGMGNPGEVVSIDGEWGLF